MDDTFSFLIKQNIAYHSLCIAYLVYIFKVPMFDEPHLSSLGDGTCIPHSPTIFEYIGLPEDAFSNLQEDCLPDRPGFRADEEDHSPRGKKRVRVNASDKEPKLPKSAIKKPNRYGCPGNKWSCLPEETRKRRAWTSLSKFYGHFQTHLEEFATPEGLKCLECERSQLSPSSDPIVIFPVKGKELAKHIYDEHMVVRIRSSQHQTTAARADGQYGASGSSSI